MNHEQEQSIQELRTRGLTYLQIADTTTLSVNTVKSYCHRHDVVKRRCKNCGKLLNGAAKRKPKTFCCDHCRQAWWKNHRDQMRQNAVYQFICENCRRPFSSYGNRHRRFCSHACYIAYRYYGAPP